MTREELLLLKNRGLSYAQIGNKFGVTRQRIHQLIMQPKYADFTSDSYREKNRHKKHKNKEMKYERKPCGYCSLTN